MNAAGFAGCKEVNMAELECEGCGEDTVHVFLHSRCHIESPTWAVLNQETGELEIICAECRKPICKFKVIGPA